MGPASDPQSVVNHELKVNFYFLLAVCLIFPTNDSETG